MRIILLGPPGAGKGTQARKLAGILEVPHISTGDIFREAMKNGNSLGIKAQTYMDSGELVPDDITVGIVEERLQRDDCQGGFLLDGFPRNKVQAEKLDEYLSGMDRPLDRIIYIQLEEEEIERRLENRRSCSVCGKVYNLIFNRPAEDGICNICGGPLVIRDDDRKEVIENRVRIYHEKTGPLVAYYGETGRLVTVDGDRPIMEILDEILSRLGRGKELLR